MVPVIGTRTSFLYSDGLPLVKISASISFGALLGIEHILEHLKHFEREDVELMVVDR